MDMTPMVDVTFLLLIFFMVTAAFTTQASIEFPSAEGEFGNNVGSEVVTVDIGDDGAFCVLTSEHEYVCPSVQELYVRLRGEMAKTPKPARLVVRASGGATHERVVIVLDAGAEVGLEDIQLETVDEDI
jgi:biopolymer transport protein ExbD